MSVNEFVSLNRTLPIDLIKYDERGLVPAIVQDYLDGTVLMMAWMNSESLAKTLSTGETWFWSRSRQEFWHKGATSGHIQHVKDLRYDCDSDALLVSVEQVGDIACHTGERSCFHQIDTTTKAAPPADTLSDLYQTVCDRRDNPQSGSYTQSLFAGGDNKILKKIGEEAAELVTACADGDIERAREETADLVYHALVALRAVGGTLADVERVLADRHAE